MSKSIGECVASLKSALTNLKGVTELTEETVSKMTGDPDDPQRKKLVEEVVSMSEQMHVATALLHGECGRRRRLLEHQAAINVDTRDFEKIAYELLNI